MRTRLERYFRLVTRRPRAVGRGRGRKMPWHHDRVFESSALSYQMEIIPGLYQLASRLSEQIRKSRVTAVGPNLGLFSVRGRGSWGRGGGAGNSDGSGKAG